MFLWGILNSDFFGLAWRERGWRQECDDRVRAGRLGLPGVRELWDFLHAYLGLSPKDKTANSTTHNF